jgi:hypothetical protein
MTLVIRRAAKPNDRRYTLSGTLEEVKRLAGVPEFDLDVAAESASHHASNWYGPEFDLGHGQLAHDGLATPWFGRVFCNPPWSQSARWVERAWAQSSEVELIAMLMPCRTDQAWWHENVEPFRDSAGDTVDLKVHFLRGRTRYGTPDDPLGLRAKSPWFASCVLVWRKYP